MINFTCMFDSIIIGRSVIILCDDEITPNNLLVAEVEVKKMPPKSSPAPVVKQTIVASPPQSEYQYLGLGK